MQHAASIVDNPFMFGEFPTRIAVGIFLIVGIVKCIAASKRPNTSSLCAHSLTSLLVSGVFATISVGLNWDENLYFYDMVVQFMFSISFFAAFLLGIGGLLTYRRGEYTQGRKQALWTIGITATIALATLAGSLVGDIIKNRKAMQRFEEIEAIGYFQAQTRKSIEQSKDIHQIKEFNCQMRFPGDPWVETSEEGRFDPAVFEMMRKDPSILFTITVEHIGNSIELDEVTEIIKENWQIGTDTDNVTLLEETPYTVNGMEGIRIYSDTTTKERAISFVHWITLHDGYVYQCITTSPYHYRLAVNAAAEELSKGFSLIDPGSPGNP